MTRPFVIFVLALTLYVPVVLLADSAGLVPQLALGSTTAMVLWLVARRGTVERRQIVAAVIVAAIGECILSLGWGLYHYRNAVIPLYVFFGHGIFYALAAESAQQRALQRIAPAIIRGVLIGGAVIAAATLVLYNDTWGLLWWVIAAVLIIRSGNQLLLSMCFVYTMLLEWLGTAIGNWTWVAAVPYTGLTSANPPSGVGLLYVLLDLITVAIFAGRTNPGTQPAAETT
ncbi:MAG TPA: hypothetical protein VM779_12965 [Thermoanaerobaculia bacterium]|nr:hypothetical protein [Thermoanaerobaculia bacterium]